MLWAAIKAMIWGLLLLIVGAVTVFSAFLGVTNLTKLRSENYAVQAGLTLAKIEPDMKRLGSIYTDMENNRVALGLEGTSFSDLRDRIKKTIREGCDCLDFFAVYAVDVSKMTTELQGKARPENIVRYNIVVLVASLAALVALVVGTHILATLLYAKRLTWLGVLINCALDFPFLLVGFVVSTINVEMPYFTIRLGGGSDALIWLIVAAALYLFVGYPPIFVVASRAKIKIQDALRLRALSH